MHIAFSPNAPIADNITFDEFLKVDIRVGTVLEAQLLDGLRKPAIGLVIDFGETVGTRKSSAQITDYYEADALIGQQVVAVVNFPTRQIGKFMSEVLTLGFADTSGAIRLIAPDTKIPNGTRMS